MKILLPVDGSECALDAVRYALHLQREGLRASFVLAVVQEPAYAFEMMLPPNAEVLDRITGAEGARGRGALSSALFGSVSQAVLQASIVPISIVKHDNGQSGR